MVVSALVAVAALAAPAPQARSCTDLADTAIDPSAGMLFGYTPDASPVSWSEVIRGNTTGRVLGFCGRLYEHLSALGLASRPCEVAFDERFGAFGESLAGRPAILCGPTSITPRRKAVLDAEGPGFSATVSRPFLVTSTKLLIRSTRIDELRQRPENLRIGLLKPRPGRQPVTTEIIEQVFANARFIDLRNRTEAVQALARPIDAADAIDAYASDEVILTDMLRRDLPAAGTQPADYAVLPPLYGYSREEYVVVAYNHSGVIEEVETWLDSGPGRDAVAAMQPQRSALNALVSGMAWGHAVAWLLGALFVLGGVLGLAAWRLRRRAFPSPDPAAIAQPRRAGDAAPHAEQDDAASANLEPAPLDAAADSPSLRDLTPREREVLRLLARGLSNKGVARQLGIEVRTVETHRRNIYTKLGVKNTAEMVKQAMALDDSATSP